MNTDIIIVMIVDIDMATRIRESWSVVEKYHNRKKTAELKEKIARTIMVTGGSMIHFALMMILPSLCFAIGLPFGFLGIRKLNNPASREKTISTIKIITQT